MQNWSETNSYYWGRKSSKLALQNFATCTRWSLLKHHHLNPQLKEQINFMREGVNVGNSVKAYNGNILLHKISIRREWCNFVKEIYMSFFVNFFFSLSFSLLSKPSCGWFWFLWLIVGFVAVVLADSRSIYTSDHKRPTFEIFERASISSEFVPPASPANLCWSKLLILDWHRLHKRGLYVAKGAKRFNLSSSLSHAYV